MLVNLRDGPAQTFYVLTVVETAVVIAAALVEVQVLVSTVVGRQ